MLSLRPWEGEALAPQVSVAPDAGVAVGGAIVATRPPAAAFPGPGVAGGHAVAGSKPVADAAGGPSLRLAVAPARPVRSAETVPPGDPVPPGDGPDPSPLSPPPAQPTDPSSTAVTVADTRPGDRSQGVGAAGLGAGAPAVGGAIGAASFEVREGFEYTLSFSFLIEPPVYGDAGSENPIVRLLGDASPDPSLGLQLRDLAGDDSREGGRGLWTRGTTMGADRFLSPVAESEWHEATIRFRVSSGEDGFHETYLDGLLVDAGYGLATLAPGSGTAHIDLGLFREDGETVAPAVRFEGVELGIVFESMSSP